MPVAVTVNFPTEKKPYCRGHLLHVDENATLFSVLRVALRDNESLNYTLRSNLIKQERPAPCLFSHHRRKRSSGAQAEEAQDSGLELVTCTYVTNFTASNTHTRSLGDSGNDVLLAARLPVPELLFPALERVAYRICT